MVRAAAVNGYGYEHIVLAALIDTNFCKKKPSVEF